jgi:hypothetical protein
MDIDIVSASSPLQETLKDCISCSHARVRVAADGTNIGLPKMSSGELPLSTPLFWMSLRPQGGNLRRKLIQFDIKPTDSLIIALFTSNSPAAATRFF